MMSHFQWAALNLRVNSVDIPIALKLYARAMWNFFFVKAQSHAYTLRGLNGIAAAMKSLQQQMCKRAETLSLSRQKRGAGFQQADVKYVEHGPLVRMLDGHDINIPPSSHATFVIWNCAYWNKKQNHSVALLHKPSSEP